MDTSQAAYDGCAVASYPERRLIALRGPDRVRFLSGMVTSDVAALTPGAAQPSVKTSAKGKIEALLRVRAADEVLYVDAQGAAGERLARTLDQFILMDDVELEDLSATIESVLVLGPRSVELLQAAGLEAASTLAGTGFAVEDGVTIVRDETISVPRYELQVPAGQAGQWIERLAAAGAVRLDPAALELLRIEQGIPDEARDLGDDTLPLEANLTREISYTKGCYVGQEVIARATHLGGVNWALAGFRLAAGAAASTGDALFLPGQETKVGELTSVVESPRFGPIALGFVRKAHQAPGTMLECGEARTPATVSALPFGER